MPWLKMKLRGSDVFARVKDDGSPIVNGGRVEIRYRLGDDKVYHAAVRNLDAVADAKVIAEPESPGAPAVVSVSSAAPVTAPSVLAAATKAVIVYADGACSGNPGPAGLGVVVIHGTRRVERSEFIGEGTNNIAELLAIQRALDLVPDPSQPIIVHTDSQYSIGVLTKSWKPKANQEIIAALKRDLVRRSSVRFVYVKGHAGIVLNERADQLARDAVTDRKTVENVYDSALSNP